jgi:putative nucleotidyltransferase with HDIG domain
MSVIMIDSSDLARQFERGEEVYLSFQYVSKDIESGINSLLVKVLSRVDKVYLYDSLESVLRELIQNAVKANIKRLWFKSLYLDINDPDDYQEGISKFKSVAYHPELMKDMLLESSYRIIVKIRKGDKGIEIDVVNNARIVSCEMDRLRNRLKKAKECKNFAEAYENMYDSSEGAGLGIILTVLLLKNAGLDVDLFNVAVEDDSFRVSIVIPAEPRNEEITSIIKSRILDEVKTLPTFPENIVQLRALCHNPDTTIDAISDRISLDPSLAADVLKLSNSAGFITGKRIQKINDAVKIIGLKNLNSLLVTAASRKIMDKRYRKFEQVWEHCNRAAYYARYIALELGRGPLADSVFIAGLLHDIGKIVLLATDRSLVNHISEMVNNRRIRTTTILEEITIGISHSTIGALIAEKWNFPEELVEAIRYHHAPLVPGIRNRDLVMIVYLANQMSHVETKLTDLPFFETEVLDRFGIGSQAEYDQFYNRMRKLYDRQEQFLQKNKP